MCRFWKFVAEPRSQPFNRSRESGDFLTGIWTSQLDSEVAKRCGYVPEAEIPKEHLRVIYQDHEVHDFQIAYLSQIASALAVRE